MNLVKAGAIQTMSSREIAALTGKRHDNVIADIRKMLVELHGEARLLSFQGTVERPNPSGGAPISSTVYLLPKRETLILVSGYNVQMRARIIDRWQELEAQAAAPINPAQLSRLQLIEIAMQAETERLALAEKVEELQPKAQALYPIATPKARGMLRSACDRGTHILRTISRGRSSKHAPRVSTIRQPLPRIRYPWMIRPAGATASSFWPPPKQYSYSAFNGASSGVNFADPQMLKPLLCQARVARVNFSHPNQA